MGSNPISESGMDTANDTVTNAIGGCPFNTGVAPSFAGVMEFGIHTTPRT